MGYTAATIDPFSSLFSSVQEFSAAICLPLFLYAWQFPHFNALSLNLKDDYARAGYRMLCIEDKRKLGLVSFRYALSLVPISGLFVFSGLCGYEFYALSSLVNAPLIYYGYLFWRIPELQQGRRLFRCTLLHLPLYLAVAIGCKIALGRRVASSSDDDDDHAQTDGVSRSEI